MKPDNTGTQFDLEWPSYSEEEIDAAAGILRSGKVNYWTGKEGREFEKEFAGYIGKQHAVAVANGSVALELALKVLGIGPGDHVVTTPRSFIATAASIVLAGARPVFADVDPVSQNLTAESIRAVLTPATKAIVVVHLAGWPCEMESIMAMAHEHGLKVIEDCAQAHGAAWKGRLAGSFGHVAAFSFCQDKIVSTGGEGGMLLTDSVEIFEQAWAYKDNGKSYNAVYRRPHEPGFRWLCESFGTNWRLTEIQSAIGRIQLRKLPAWLDARRRNAALLTDCMSQLSGLRVTVPPQEAGHAYYKYYAFVRPEALRAGWSRDAIVAAINAQGVACSTGSCSEVYLEKAFPAAMRPATRLPVARELGETSLMFPVHPTRTGNDLLVTCEVVRQVMAEAAK